MIGFHDRLTCDGDDRIKLRVIDSSSFLAALCIALTPHCREANNGECWWSQMARKMTFSDGGGKLVKSGWKNIYRLAEEEFGRKPELGTSRATY